MQLTALQIIRQAAAELGLNVPNEVAASTEVTGQQMLALLNSAGADLIVAHPWQQLNVTHVFPSVAAQAEYALPSDYAYYLDQTFWCSSEQEPMAGPVSPQFWQRVTAGAIALPSDQMFRVQAGNVEIYPTPSEVQNYTYQYISNLWVQCGASPPACKASITLDADTPLLDSNLLVKALKVKMWNAKGLDTTMLIGEMTGLFNALTGKDKGATILSLSPRGGSSLLNSRSIPDGSWNV